MSNEVQKHQTPIEQEAAKSLIGLLGKYKKAMEGTIPKQLTPARFAWLCVNSIRATPALAGCTPVSFINSVMLAANLGLEIRRNSAYLIPYGKECQLIIDYRGKMDLARRAGVKAFSIELVHAKDHFDYYLAAMEGGAVLHHRPALLRELKSGELEPIPESERGEVVLGYAMADVGGGSPQIEVMSLAAIEKIRARARSGRANDFEYYGKTKKGLTLADIRALQSTPEIPKMYSVPWVTDWDQMARKTLAHRICNYVTQSSQVLLSQEVDTAADTGTDMPIAEQLTDLVLEIDPADNRPMVDIPDTPEERKAEQDHIVESKVTELNTQAQLRASIKQVAEQKGMK